MALSSEMITLVYSHTTKSKVIFLPHISHLFFCKHVYDVASVRGQIRLASIELSRLVSRVKWQRIFVSLISEALQCHSQRHLCEVAHTVVTEDVEGRSLVEIFVTYV